MMLCQRWSVGAAVPVFFAPVLLAGVMLVAGGCTRRTGGVVEETDEFSFDQIAATAAAETAQSESSESQ